MHDEFNNDLVMLPRERVWGLPIIRRIHYEDLTSIQLSAYHLRKAPDKQYKFVHFFISDDHFSGMCKNPKNALIRIRKFAGALSPDFSTPWDWPLVDQLWNIRRSRFFGAYWQSKGISVIPTVTWGDARSYPFCFLGIEKQSTVALASFGLRFNAFFRSLFIQGFEEMVTQLDPYNVLWYGDPVEGITYQNIVYIRPQIQPKIRCNRAVDTSGSAAEEPGVA